MKYMIGTLGACLAWSAVAVAQERYETSVVLRDLQQPSGIAVKGSGTIYFTQLPTPGVPGSMGGSNTVSALDLNAGTVTTLTMGEPEPTNLALDKRGSLYWTCKSAGVILQRSRSGDVSLFLGELLQPSGIAVDRWSRVYFTTIPTPGIPGTMGGSNAVYVTDGATVTELSMGEPEPSDIAVARDGTAYWTCKTAGVILMRDPAGNISLLLGNLSSPTGIAVDHRGRNLYWTEVPTPGVSGANGGSNKVSQLDLATMEVNLVDSGDPQPTDIAVARNGNLYWTCTSAGVIVEARRRGRK